MLVENEEPSEISLPTTLWYSLANLGCGTFFAINNALIGPYLSKFTSNAIILGLMSNSHSAEGAIIQPLIGGASDRCQSRLGKRRPFMLVFFPLCALFMIVTPAAATTTARFRLPLVISCIFLFTLLFNMGFDPYQALMPDITPPKQREKVTAVWTLFGLAGQILILFLPVSINIAIVLSAVLLILTLIATLFTVNEKPTQSLPPSTSLGKTLRISLQGLKLLKQARMALGIYFAAGLSIGAVLPFLTEFVIHITHCSTPTAAQMFIMLMVFTAIGVPIAGKISVKTSTVTLLMLGLGLILLAALAGLFVKTIHEIIFVMVLAGLGNGAQSVASYPLITKLVPEEEVGFYTGLQSTAASIAQPLIVTLTGYFINIGSYRVIFGVCSFGLLIALLLLTRIRMSYATDEIMLRRLEIESA